MADFTFKAKDVWASLLRDCAEAKSSIEVEQYILMNDAIGERFLSLLRDRAAEGVKVRLLLDSVGSRSLSGHPLINELRELGAEVCPYNRLHWRNIFTPHRWFPRNHAKSAMIDARIFHIGSACMADYMTEWEEAHVRIEGETIHNVEQDFLYKPEKAENGYRYLRSRPGHRNPIYHEMLRCIREATRNICIVTPYFMPPILLKRAIVGAAKRGVDVRIMVAARPDVGIAGVVAQTYFERMRKQGVRFYLYEPEMMHAKYVVVDNNWAMIGSANLDYLSMLRNRESNLVIEDDSVVARLSARFDQASGQCRMVDADFWPQVSLPVKALGYLGRVLKKVL